ncbi:MAG: PilZ domain-containing protein [Desulfobacterium sp.]
MTPSKNDNRRKFDRVEFSTPIKIILDIDGKAVELSGCSKDLSLKGIYIDTRRRFKPGTACSVKIHLTGSSKEIELIMQASITRETAKGMGISFDSMDVDSYAHLKNIVKYNCMDDVS